MTKCRPILLSLVAIWQQDYAPRKPSFSLAPNFRCADDRLSNGENGTIADGHRADTSLRSAERTYSEPRRQPHEEGATKSVGASVPRPRAIPRDAVST